jgi:hypothetical protein
VAACGGLGEALAAGWSGVAAAGPWKPIQNAKLKNKNSEEEDEGNPAFSHRRLQMRTKEKLFSSAHICSPLPAFLEKFCMDLPMNPTPGGTAIKGPRYG